MTISVHRLSDMLATTASGRRYRIEAFSHADRRAGPPITTRYILSPPPRKASA